MKKNTAVNSGIYRQGDVNIRRVDSNIPEKLVKTKHNTLAYGEVKGHHHTFTEGGVTCFADTETALPTWVTVDKGGAPLTHQEHDTIVLPEGTYQVSRQVEYTPAALRNVQD